MTRFKSWILTDVAGEVVAVGASVTTLAPGDRVLGMTNPENTLSLASIRGLGNLSGGIDLPGHTMFGGYAQFVSRPESYWIKVRPDLDLDQGAAAMWPCATAHRIITNRLNVRMNDNVLITGAAGGMGTATIALAKLAGATVIATTRHPGKATSLERWGADIVVDSGGDDAVKAIRAATGGEVDDPRVEIRAVATMKVHEYQAKELLKKAGVAVPEGIVATTAAEAAKAYDALGGGLIVVKAQVHAGGRGKGVAIGPDDDRALALEIASGRKPRPDSMAKGVQLVKSAQEAEKAAASLLAAEPTMRAGPVIAARAASRTLATRGATTVRPPLPNICK